MEYPDVLHHGVNDGLTGSCYQLLMGAWTGLPIDCGLFQGVETTAESKIGLRSLRRPPHSGLPRAAPPPLGRCDATAHPAGRHRLAFEQLVTVDSHLAREAMVRHLAQAIRPAIVIAANGMCSGGQIANYLKAMLHDLRHNLLFVVYQALGTPGRAIQTCAARGGDVDLDGER